MNLQSFGCNNTKRNYRDIKRRTKSENLSILFISHDLRMEAKISDRIVNEERDNRGGFK